jgi:hypothetical protein
MNKRIILAALVTAALVGCQSTSTGNQASTDSNGAYSALAGAALTAAMQAWGAQGGETLSLADSVQQATSVSTDQAVGGVGSLLALAQNSLSSTQNSELGGLVPGYSALSSSGLTSLITSSDAVNNAFSAMGLDPSMVSTFAPIILSALQSQGASSTLINSLGTIWQ